MRKYNRFYYIKAFGFERFKTFFVSLKLFLKSNSFQNFFFGYGYFWFTLFPALFLDFLYNYFKFCFHYFLRNDYFFVRQYVRFRSYIRSGFFHVNLLCIFALFVYILGESNQLLWLGFSSMDDRVGIALLSGFCAVAWWIKISLHIRRGGNVPYFNGIIGSFWFIKSLIEAFREPKSFRVFVHHSWPFSDEKRRQAYSYANWDSYRKHKVELYKNEPDWTNDDLAIAFPENPGPGFFEPTFLKLKFFFNKIFDFFFSVFSNFYQITLDFFYRIDFYVLFDYVNNLYLSVDFQEVLFFLL